MAGLLHDVGVQGQALLDEGTQVFGSIGSLFTVDGIGLVSDGILWPKGAIWSFCEASVTTVWTAIHTPVSAVWTDELTPVTTTWT